MNAFAVSTANLNFYDIKDESLYYIYIFKHPSGMVKIQQGFIP